MSIRRESCDPCFRARRKCDRKYPICERCKRSNKPCHYVYPPPLPTQYAAEKLSNIAFQHCSESSSISLATNVSETEQSIAGLDVPFQTNHSQAPTRAGQLSRQAIPTTLFIYNEPLSSGRLELGWVFDQILQCPLAFANEAETMFIHKDLLYSTLPMPLRTAFGICTGMISSNVRSQPVLFGVITTEISDLLVQAPESGLLGDLARLQASVLYQIIRFFYGNIYQCILAEQQEFLLRSYGLKLLRRVDTELHQMEPNWETWILVESIRRTVIIVFKLYTLYWAFRNGTSIETSAIKMLPVSMNPSCWASREIYLQCSDRDQTTTYGDIAASWEVSSWKNLGTFETLLLTSFNGINSFNAGFNLPDRWIS
ncbi:hypothetical protein GGI42DRAFT_356544 [Trichoderma sp. SZMC 28013]